MIKDIRILIWLGLVLIALGLLAYPRVFKSRGVLVTFVSEGSPCEGVIPEGSVITEVNGVPISGLNDFSREIKGLSGPTTFVVDANPRTCNVPKDSDLNVTVVDLRSGGLKFGIDIEGGTRVLLKVDGEGNETTKDLRDDIQTIIQTRIDLYGLKDMRIYPIGEDMIQIEMAGAKGEEVKNFLVEQGKFEAKILEVVKLEGDEGELRFNGEDYPVKVDDDQVLIQGSYHEGSFQLDGIKFEVENVTNDSLVVSASVYAGEDIKAVYTDSQRSRLDYVGNAYQFSFTVQISDEGAKRFAKITEGQEIAIGSTGEGYLVTPLVLYLDEKPVSQLSISSDLAGKEVLTPSISGGSETKRGAIEERNRLQSILKSGSLPTKPEILKIDTLSPILGKTFINSVVYVVLAASFVVCVVIFMRYRNPKIIFPMVLTSLSEVILILGVASSQVFTVMTLMLAIGLTFVRGEMGNWLRWLAVFLMFVFGFAIALGGWVLDVPAIAGLIAVIGTGVNQMIIITDQILLRKKDESIERKRKVALEIVWSSATIVVAAMFPLFFLGVGMLKGFAITTVMGVMIGVMITRPAYAAILEKVI